MFIQMKNMGLKWNDGLIFNLPIVQDGLSCQIGWIVFERLTTLKAN